MWYLVGLLIFSYLSFSLVAPLVGMGTSVYGFGITGLEVATAASRVYDGRTLCTGSASSRHRRTAARTPPTAATITARCCVSSPMW